MNKRTRNSAAVLSLMLICALSAAGGPNKGAKIVIDQNAATAEMDSVCAISSTVYTAVLVKNVASMTGFMVRIAFDSTVLKFDKAELVVPGSGMKPILETNGGIPGPFLVKAVDAGTVDVAAGVKSADGVAVSGSGLLVYLTFTRLNDTECAVTVAKAQLSDVQLKIDTIIGQ
jgi:hypothetical protein